MKINRSSLLSRRCYLRKIIKNTKLVTYTDAPHGMCTTLENKVNEGLLAFFEPEFQDR
jgi:hypothetical protein